MFKKLFKKKVESEKTEECKKYYKITFAQQHGASCSTQAYMSEHDFNNLDRIMQNGGTYIVVGNESRLVVNLKYVQSIMCKEIKE